MKLYIKLFVTSILLSLSQAQFSNTQISYEYNENIIQNDKVYILNEFISEIEKYFNNSMFTYEYNFLDIPVKIHFIFEKILFTGGNNYNTIVCQFLISNSYDQYFLVKTINLPFHKGKTLYFNEISFDPLTSIFDYFINLFIAYELDGYGLFLGDIYYNKATEISSMGISSGFSSGWDKRRENIRVIKNNEYLRIARNQFYNCMELYYSESYNKEKLNELTINILKNLKLIHSNIGYEKNTLKFINAFHEEIVELFNLFNLNEGIEFLYKFDDKNKVYYENFLDK